MTQDSLVDVLADIRYRLRHAAINEGFVAWLDEGLEMLRSRYRRNRSEFRSDDIIFLQHLSGLLPLLSKYLAYERRVVSLEGGERLFSELVMLGCQIEQMHEESFSSVSTQCVALQREVEALCKTPNNPVEKDVSPQSDSSPSP